MNEIRNYFAKGQRLIDQNRFSDVINWHLPDGDTWHYLPVPFEEVLNNQIIHKNKLVYAKSHINNSS